MLAKANRVTRPNDFKSVVRRGRRVSTSVGTVHVLSTSDQPTRFGFIVSKSVGNAVVRNRVRRRMRAVCFDLLPSMRTGSDVVVRAAPGAVAVSWATLHSELESAIGAARGS